MRKQKWLRMSKFNYARNISDLDKTAADLETHGFVETTIGDLAEALAVLSKDELKAIAKERNIHPSTDSTVSASFSTSKCANGSLCVREKMIS